MITQQHAGAICAARAFGIAALFAVAWPVRAADPVDDPAPILRALRDAQGGPEAWQQVHYLRFDWVVERDGKETVRARHLWDRQTGLYRVEWKNREGQSMLGLFDVDTRAGRVWVDGAAPAAADSAAMLERAYGRFINDTYWLLMPAKLEDPGVKVETAGTADFDGRPSDILHITFGPVGLTPGDHYWAYIDRNSHLMTRWAFFLQGDEGTPALEKASAWDWADWQRVGGVMMSRDRRQVGGEGRRIHFPVLAVLDRVDPKVFSDPTAGMPEGSAATAPSTR